jgi:hypothetical protein
MLSDDAVFPAEKQEEPQPVAAPAESAFTGSAFGVAPVVEAKKQPLMQFSAMPSQGKAAVKKPAFAGGDEEEDGKVKRELKRLEYTEEELRAIQAHQLSGVVEEDDDEDIDGNDYKKKRTSKDKSSEAVLAAAIAAASKASVVNPAAAAAAAAANAALIAQQFAARLAAQPVRPVLAVDPKTRLKQLVDQVRNCPVCFIINQ